MRANVDPYDTPHCAPAEQTAERIAGMPVSNIALRPPRPQLFHVSRRGTHCSQAIRMEKECFPSQAIFWQRPNTPTHALERSGRPNESVERVASSKKMGVNARHRCHEIIPNAA